jgi:hypothetical protein
MPRFHRPERPEKGRELPGRSFWDHFVLDGREWQQRPGQVRRRDQCEQRFLHLLPSECRRSRKRFIFLIGERTGPVDLP